MMAASLVATYRFADVAAAVSQGAAKDVARLALFSEDQVKVLHNPIPPRPFPSAESLEQAEAIWGCPHGARILTVGNLKPVKNHPLLLRALAALQLPDARLMILGRGENETMLRSLAADLGIRDRVIFAGFHADPSLFYATADLFVLSSDYEGLPTVLIEALSFGVPIVSTDCPSGPAEILDNGRYGALVPVGDAEALARAMGVALHAYVDRDTLKHRALDFAPEIAARKYLELLGL
jgi:glycosyltransferase involved in cell wall biosynthesis